MPLPTRNVTPGPSAPVNHSATMGSNTVATAVLQSHRTVVNWREKNHHTPKRGSSELLDDGERDRKKPKMDLRMTVGGTNGPQRPSRDERDKKHRRRRKKRNLSITGISVDSVQHQERHPSVSTLSAGPAAESMTQSTIVSIAETASAAEMISEDEQPTYSSSDKGKGKARSVASPRGSVHGSPAQRQLAASRSPSRNVIEHEASGSSSNTNDNPESNAQPSEIARLKEQLAEQRKLLEKHQKHLHQQQQALTCQICLDLMHRPYALAPCGHVACYGCLVRWFTALQNPNEAFGAIPGRQQQQEGEAGTSGDDVGQILNSASARRGIFIRRRKTCPICRATVSARPVEMWEIKNMVSALVRSQLVDLIQGPSTLEVNDNQGESASGNPNHNDPWHNIFRPSLTVPQEPHVQAINREQVGFFDAEDGVYRCIDCYYEIWGGVCSGCERAYGDFFHEEEEDEDIPSDLDQPVQWWGVDPPEDDEISIGDDGPDYGHEIEDIWLEQDGEEEYGEEAGEYGEDLDDGLAEALDRWADGLADEYDEEEETHADILRDAAAIYRFLDEEDEESSGGDMDPEGGYDSDDQDNSEDPENFATESESEPDLPRNQALRSTARRRVLDSDDDPENIPLESDSDPTRLRTDQEADSESDGDPLPQVRWNLRSRARAHQEDQDNQALADGLSYTRYVQRARRRTRVGSQGISAGSESDDAPVIRRSTRRTLVQPDSGSDSYYSY